MPTGKKDGSEKFITVFWTTGIGQWPSGGGLDDQDFYTQRIFNAFLRGDQKGTLAELQKQMRRG